MSDFVDRLVSQRDVVPPSPRDGDRLLEEVAAFLRCYVVFQSSAQVVAVVLWTAHTHAIEAADATPYLAVTSPEKRSGKSRLFDVLALLVASPWNAADVSEATVYRKVSHARPTLLLDETDAIFSKNGERDGLRALLNAGHRRGAVVSRCVGEGARIRVEDFEVFCAKALAGLGHLPDTVADRSIPIRFQRRRKSEPVERFRFRAAKVAARPLQEALGAWTQANLASLVDARPELPEALDDRAQDGWEPLLALADEAGGDWPSKARKAAVELHGARSDEDASLGALLLVHVRQIFEEIGTNRLSTEDLLRALIERDDGPWAMWWEKPLKDGNTRGPASRLSHILRPFGIETHKKIRVGTKSVRGYPREAFAEAWERYVPLETDRKKEQGNAAGHGPNEASLVDNRNDPKTGPGLRCSLVPTSLIKTEEPGLDNVGTEQVDVVRAAFPNAEVVASEELALLHQQDEIDEWNNNVMRGEVT